MFIITIDGKSATGKSTIAKLLAEKLNVKHIDAGMIFRAAAFSLNNGIEDISIKLDGEKVILNDRDISDLLRDPNITKSAIVAGSSEKLKSLVFSMQRDIAKKNSVVVSGRDTGAVVFPNADFKFFITADIDIRAIRRAKDYNNKISVSDIKELLIKRDEEDIKRGTLIQPNDSILIDNSNKSIDQVILEIISYIKID
jgi:cytidylate kinase